MEPGPKGNAEEGPVWADEPAAPEPQTPGAGLAAWASLFGLLPHRYTPAPGDPRLTTPTCLLGLASWILLLLGTPLVSYSLAGCIGAVFELLAFVLVVLFVTRVLVETRFAAAPRRTLGQVGLILAVLLVLYAAWGPAGLFGQQTRRIAEAKHHLESGAQPTADMRSAAWWEIHSWLGLIATWIAAVAVLPASLRLLGVKSPRLLVLAAAVGGSTGPLLLAACTALLKAGWN